jgi:hypothetical protein
VYSLVKRSGLIIFVNPLKHELHLNNIQKLISNSTENIMRLGYKYRKVSGVLENNRSVL